MNPGLFKNCKSIGFEMDPSNIKLKEQSEGVGPNKEAGINFWGQSFIADPYGRMLMQASREQEEVVVCPIDLSFIEKVKIGFSFPYRDRRVDSYQDLLQLYSE